MCTGTHDFIPAADTARVDLVYSSQGNTLMNVIYFRRAGGFDAGQLEALAEATIAAWDDNIKALTTANVSLNLVRATDISSEGAAGVEVSAGPLAGTNTTGINLPLNVTVVTKFSTGLTGRSHRGRIYFVGLNGSEIVANALASGVAATINTAWTSFFGDITTLAADEHVIVSLCNNGAWRTAAEVTPVTNYSTNGDLDSQRRRLNTRGM